MQTKSNISDTKFSRRQFLRGATASVATFMVVPGSVLGLNGATSPNEKLNLAGIGTGGQGSGDLRNLESENIVAVCDVDRKRAAGVFNRYPNAKQFGDYRKMLDEMKEIDGIVVATPDHHHAFASMAAIRRGKHVYCEKPLTHSVWEARQLAKAAREAKVATQMGNQGQASPDARRLSELVWSGVIGPVREAHMWTDRPLNGLFNEYWPQGVGRPKETPAIPDTLDWDMWVGPAPMRPYNPAYLPFVWRGWWDFGTGALGDMGCHSMDPVFRALKLGAPASVEASSSRVNQDTYPAGSMVTYHFPARSAALQTINPHISGVTGTAAGGIEMPPCKLVWYDGGLRPPRPEGLPSGANMGTNGRLLIGDKGFILGSRIFPASLAEGAAQFPRLPASPGHIQEWVLAAKGGKPAGANFDFAGPLTEAVLLGNVALRVQLRAELAAHTLLWNSEEFKFTNSDDANEFLSRKYRAGWTL